MPVGTLPVFVKYGFVVVWLILTFILILGATEGRSRGMVRERPPLRSWLPLLAIIWVMVSFIASIILMPPI